MWINNPHKIKCDGKVLHGWEFCSNKADDWSLKNKIETLKKEGLNAEIYTIDRTFGKWIDFGFFKIRGYKKGTIHFEFVSEDVWMEFNRRVAKIKGWQLPQKTDTKKRK